MGTYDIGIAGCGIAGLATALLLARDGHSVRIYERFAQPQPLGSGLLIQPTGLAVLERLGLAGMLVQRGARVRSIRGENRNGERVLDARYGDLSSSDVFGVGIHRATLFEALFAAVASAGIPLESGCDVTAVVEEGASKRLAFLDGRISRRHDLIVDCLGVASALTSDGGAWLPFGALWANVACHQGDPFDLERLEQRYDRASRMVGVLPIGGGQIALFWSLRADRHDAWRAAGLCEWKAEVAELWPNCACLLERIDQPQELTFARYAHRTALQPVEGRTIHIGDAWHSASPQLGQGANMALLDAWALAKGLRECGDIDEGLRRFLALRRPHVRLYQWLTALVTPLYQSDALAPALLRDVLLAPLSRIGPAPRIQASLVAGLVGNPLAALGLDMPRYDELSDGSVCQADGGLAEKT